MKNSFSKTASSARSGNISSRLRLLYPALTSGFIITFKFKPESETAKPINYKRGFKRITFLVSFVSMLSVFIIGTLYQLIHYDMALSVYLIGIVPAAGAWVIYVTIWWIVVPFVCWTIKGFEQDKDSSKH
ncbi:hypothetical protein ACFLZ8_03890 [Planctomycetota bacterium]